MDWRSLESDSTRSEVMAKFWQSEQWPLEMGLDVEMRNVTEVKLQRAFPNSSVQSLSRVRLFETPWTAARQASLSTTNSQSLPKVMSTELVMPSNHLILCRPFSSCLQSFPASGSFPVSQLFTSDGQGVGVSASTSALPKNIQDWFPLGWTGWISLQSKRLSRVFSNTTAQKHQFFGAQLSFFFFEMLEIYYYYLLSTSLILQTFQIIRQQLILPHPSHPKFLIKSSSSKDTHSSLLCIKLYEIKTKNCVHLAVNAVHGCGARVHPRLALLSRSWKTLVHELSLHKASPPLAGFIILRVKNFLTKSQSSLLPQLL